MMYYALKSALLLTLLYGGFSALLSRETFHRFNRMLLLGILVLSMVLPAVHITIPVEQKTQNTLTLPFPSVMEDSEHTQEQFSMDEVITPLPRKEWQRESLESLKSLDLQTIYIIGLFVAFVCFVRRGVLLARSLRGGLRLRDEQGNTIVVKGGTLPPFSFMHWIAINVSDYEQHRRSILTHEQAHARLGHSWDLLLLEMVQVVQWFNPFAFVKASMQNNINNFS